MVVRRLGSRAVSRRVENVSDGVESVRIGEIPRRSVGGVKMGKWGAKACVAHRQAG